MKRFHGTRPRCSNKVLLQCWWASLASSCCLFSCLCFSSSLCADAGETWFKSRVTCSWQELTAWMSLNVKYGSPLFPASFPPCVFPTPGVSPPLPPAACAPQQPSSRPGKAIQIGAKIVQGCLHTQTFYYNNFNFPVSPTFAPLSFSWLPQSPSFALHAGVHGPPSLGKAVHVFTLYNKITFYPLLTFPLPNSKH